MKLWRLYVGLPKKTTELSKILTRETLRNIVSLHLAGASISFGTGIWKGVLEDNAVIEVIQEDQEDYMLEVSLHNLILHLKTELKQESIYITCTILEKAYLI